MTNIIDELIKYNDINAKAVQYDKFILLDIDDDKEKIESFFKVLERKLPVSIFMEDSKVVESVCKSGKLLDKNDITTNISPTNEEVINLIKKEPLDLSYLTLALTKNKMVKLKTNSGYKLFMMASKENREKLESINKDVHLFISNTNALKDLFSSNSKDIQLLCSVEKPLLKMKMNLKANLDKQISNTSFVYTKLPDDKNSFLFAHAVKKFDIDYLLYCNAEVDSLSDETYEDDNLISAQDDLVVTYLGHDTLLVKGDKSVFPKFDYSSQKIFNSSKEYFENHGGVYKAILSQHNKRVKSSIGIYFSYDSQESEIAINVPGRGKLSVIEIPNIMPNFSNCMEEIKDIDENTPRLIENYKKKFPEVFEDEDRVLDNTNGFRTILDLTAQLMGMKDLKEFEDTAINCGSKSGVKIDMLVKTIDDVNYLDYRRIVQSIMSYKMAGVDNTLLAFSFYESLSEFIVDYATRMKDEIKSSDIVLCGDMFANSILISKTNKALEKTFNVILPKDYPLDMYQ